MSKSKVQAILSSQANIFEKASRLNLRFETTKGIMTVEDLWELRLTSTDGRANLDEIAIELDHKLKNENQVSFVKREVMGDPFAALQFAIVKHIIDVRLAEEAAEAAAKANREKRQRILLLIDQKQNEELSQKSVAELQALLNDDSVTL